MLELGSNHFAGGLRRMIAADAGLDVLFQFVESYINTSIVSCEYSFIATN